MTEEIIDSLRSIQAILNEQGLYDAAQAIESAIRILRNQPTMSFYY